MTRFLFFWLGLCVLLNAGCTTTLTPLTRTSRESPESTINAQARATGQLPLQTRSSIYQCRKQLYPINLKEKFAARAAQVHMVDDNHIEIEMWIYRPDHVAIAQGAPLPTAPPDGYAPEFLPTDYAVYHYNFITDELSLVEQKRAPFRSDFCRGACEQQMLDQSPDGAWQLVAVKYAWGESYNGLWLVHRNHFQRLLVPFNPDEPYRSSEAWWRWQSDSTGLFLTYRTAGERSYAPLFVRLSVPPSYSFLLEGVHFVPSMTFNNSIPINNEITLLNVNGVMILDDGRQVTQQWFIYQNQIGVLRQASVQDFEALAKYVFTGKNPDLKLTAWNPEQQQRWIAEHPTEDIWNTLGAAALYSEPYRTQTGTIRIPIIGDTREPIQLLDCTPDLLPN
jgi:hypothetical protein